MNTTDPNAQPSDDEAHDPMLAALRRRVNEYGQTPPPDAWAAIRQRLPPPAVPQPVPQPWWRQPLPQLLEAKLPLLGLLAGALLIIGLLVVRRERPENTQQPGSQPQYEQQARSGPESQAPLDRATASHQAQPAPDAKIQAQLDGPPPAKLPGGGNAALPRGSATSPPTSNSSAASASPRLAKAELHQRSNQPTARGLTRPFPTTAEPAAEPAGRTSLALEEAADKSTRGSKHGTPANRPKPYRTYRAPARGVDAGWKAASKNSLTQQASNKLLARPGLSRQRGRSSGYHPLAPALTLLPTVADGAPGLKRASAARPASNGLPRATAGQRAANHQLAYSPSAELNIASANHSEGGSPPGASPVRALMAGVSSGRQLAIEGLPFRAAALVCSPTLVPALPTPRPDSARPAPPRLRPSRWALLALVGPTISYRTLSAAPDNNASNVAGLERPAPGLGAQMQLRRVLSGRWSLAVGLGYHKYATSLTLQVRSDSDSTYRTVNQHDAYQMLTLPVQLGYTLHGPRGRLATAVLVGAEPAWYLGGRSTAPGGQQLSYNSAAASPYQPWVLGFSLGLDLRYRLGSPASRWQLLVQPTGRYVLTSFVRPDATGYPARQPFSLGVLTGFAWELR